MPRIHELRGQAPVHKGRVRELLGLPHHDRHVRANGRQHYTALTYEACEAGFRDPQTFLEFGSGPHDGSGPIFDGHPRDGPADPPRLSPHHPAQIPHARGDGLVAQAHHRQHRPPPDRAHGPGDRADLNLDFCARIPVYTITTGIGLDGDEALRFRHAYLNSTSQSRNTTMEVRISNGRIVEETLLGLIAARRAEPQDDLICSCWKPC